MVTLYSNSPAGVNKKIQHIVVGLLIPTTCLVDVEKIFKPQRHKEQKKSLCSLCLCGFLSSTLQATADDGLSHHLGREGIENTRKDLLRVAIA
jgi:hypothetical protein